MSATEAQAEKAIAILKRAIDAAENGNQAGEDAVVAMAAGLALLEALEGIMQFVPIGFAATGAPGSANERSAALQAARGAARAAIAKAGGAA